MLQELLSKQKNQSLTDLDDFDVRNFQVSSVHDDRAGDLRDLQPDGHLTVEREVSLWRALQVGYQVEVI